MTYKTLNELFVKNWADGHGFIHGKPVMLIYRMNMAAGPAGMDAIVDEELLQAELDKHGLVLDGR